MKDDPRDAMLEGATGAFRARDASGRVQPSPDWWDLSPADREELFRRQMETRLLERGVDPDGVSGTVRAVLGRLAGG